MMRSLTFPTFEYRAEALSELQTRMRSAFDDGAQIVVLDLRRLPSLAFSDVRALITLLRSSREIGRDVALRVAQREVWAVLKAMSLDKVFSIEAGA